jgi:hypothetical protein
MKKKKAGVGAPAERNEQCNPYIAATRASCKSNSAARATLPM